ncbi:MAG: potassium channel family protein [Armatimonadota bacterium]
MSAEVAGRGPTAIVRFRVALVVLLAIVVAATIAYRLVEGWPLLDCFYMTVITLATVGYKEVGPLSAAGKVITMAVIVFGITTAAWAVGLGAEILIGEELTGSVAVRKMQKAIAAIRDHFIICGFGRMGKQIAADFARRGLPFVVVEDNPEQIHALVESGYLFLQGDATRDSVLKAAGVSRAKGLVAVASSDPVNVFIVLTARGLNPNLYIVARSVLQENEVKLLRAGANKVVSPYVIGGHRMAAAVLHPAVADFLDMVMLNDELGLQLGEAHVLEESPLIGLKVGGPEVTEGYKVSVVAVRKVGWMLAQPNPDKAIEAGDTLIVVGSQDAVSEFARAASGQKGTNGA